MILWRGVTTRILPWEDWILYSIKSRGRGISQGQGILTWGISASCNNWTGQRRILQQLFWLGRLSILQQSNGTPRFYNNESDVEKLSCNDQPGCQGIIQQSTWWGLGIIRGGLLPRPQKQRLRKVQLAEQATDRTERWVREDIYILSLNLVST